MPFAQFTVLVVALACVYCWREHLRFGRFLVERTKTSASLRDGAHYTRSFWGAIGSIVAKVFGWLERRRSQEPS
ncbi:hypothetical protein GCM10022223_19940 [Kineosporia mesophila]|uniref:Secreted protein n=1 Tax=Kineosporia mesophila TaxID=566012 RepID=A0ABP6ZE91_9ACTN